MILNEIHRGARHSLLLAARTLRYIPRSPAQLADVTLQPIIVILLFGFIFGSAIHLPGTTNYREFLIPGMLATSMTGTLPGLMVAVSGDAHSEFTDRLRSLPIHPIVILLGRLISELATSVLGLFVLMVTGYLSGWRPHCGIGEFAAGTALLVVWAFAFSWLGCLLGLLTKDGESAGTVGGVALFPLMLLSSNFVPSGTLPTPLRQIANWNPMSATGTAVRNLFRNPTPDTPHVWVLDHPITATLLFSLALVAVCAPLALRRFAALSK